MENSKDQFKAENWVKFLNPLVENLIKELENLEFYAYEEQKSSWSFCSYHTNRTTLNEILRNIEKRTCPNYLQEGYDPVIHQKCPSPHLATFWLKKKRKNSILPSSAIYTIMLRTQMWKKNIFSQNNNHNSADYNLEIIQLQVSLMNCTKSSKDMEKKIMYLYENQFLTHRLSYDLQKECSKMCIMPEQINLYSNIPFENSIPTLSYSYTQLFPIFEAVPPNPERIYVANLSEENNPREKEFSFLIA